MKQPDLGRKISELRLAKGLTQGELAEKCNLSLRTIQRIESAEVTPRSYTIKLIFENLDYDIYNSFGKLSYKLDRMAYRNKIRLGQINRYVLDLFNLKTKTMKKITILSVPLVSLIFLFLFTGLDSKAQNKEKSIAQITQSNILFVNWFNSGQIDSIGMLYMENACMIPANYKEIVGRENIKGYYQFLYDTGFRFSKNESRYFKVTDKVAVDRGIWTANSSRMAGSYLSQWRYENGKWLIENEMTNSEFPVVSLK
jgi:transcriptional regulator with XRE-family HTH domain/ketosteroid isomerase-like protein